MLPKTSVELIILTTIFCTSAVDVKTFNCVKTPKQHNSNDIYHPQCDADPPRCTLKDSRREFPCIIGNMNQSQPGTCKAAKTMLKENNSQKHNSSKPWTSGEGQDLECYARLSSTDLYVLTCTNPEPDIHEVSLSFSFKIPDCNLAKLKETQSVMVDFNGRNDSIKNYHSEHPTCRTFNYTGATFEERDVKNFPPVHYDCMAIGLRYGYPHTYYFLALTTLPSGHMLNYTIVFEEGDFFKHVPSAKQSSYDLVMDSKTKTLRLLAAAWLSPQAIHVVFVPLKEVTLYRVDLKSGQWNASKNVTTAEAKMENITSGASEVQVTVTPISSKVCSNANGVCSNISVTLHREGNSFLGPLPPEKLPERISNEVLYICIFLFTGIIISTFIIFILWRRRQGPKQAIFVIGERETTRNITGVLEKYAKLTWVEELSLRDVPSTLKMSNRIFIILTSSMNETIPEIILERIPLCLVNTLKHKTVVVLVGGSRLTKPSALLARSRLSSEHLSYLNHITRFRWPLEKRSMENFLKQTPSWDEDDEADSVIYPLTVPDTDTAPDSTILWGNDDLWCDDIEPPISTSNNETPRNRLDSQTFVKTPLSIEAMRGSIFPSFLNVGRDGGALEMRYAPFPSGHHNDALFRENHHVQHLLYGVHPTIPEASGAECSFALQPHTADESHLLGCEQNEDYMHGFPARFGNIDRHTENVQTYHSTTPEDSQYLAGLECGHMLPAISRQNGSQHQVYHTPVGSCVRNWGQIDNGLRGSSGQRSQHETPHRHLIRDVHISSNQSADSGIVHSSGSRQVYVDDSRMPSARESSGTRFFQDLDSGPRIQTRSEDCGIYASGSHSAEINPLYAEQSRKSGPGIPGDVMAQRKNPHHSGGLSAEGNADRWQLSRGRRSPMQHSDESLVNLDSGQFSCNTSL